MVMRRKERLRSSERRGGVELLLTEDIPSLGKQGEIVRVKPGFARNFLLPQGLATVATEANKQMVEKHRERQEAVRQQRLDQIRKLANEVSKYSVTLEANATDEGHLYGSIVATDISKALKAANYAVEPEHIRLEGPLKELGMYTVKLQFDPDVAAEVKVWVVPAATVAT
ncbi:MAG: 50S ribosomal protein L9 [Maioricimonas sp. JB045]|uniref:50S ribosomal protein L9 n=1 Tax=Maioricimonas sp. JC845 TaxID=3232138 RepID=UPI00345B15C1